MSRAVTPVRADGPSLVAIRGLLERNLLDRAIALSESRWPGSGPLVRLSYEWAQLPPAERRDRLASIGPEELARLRGVAELQPDLARVLDDLEARGIIPPAAPIVDEPAPHVPLTQQEQMVDAVLDLAEEQVVQAAHELEPRLERIREQLQEANLDPALIPPARDVLATPDESRQESAETTARFLADQAEQRLRAAEQANEALERVRATLERSATRLVERPVTTAPVVQSQPDNRDHGPVAVAVAQQSDEVTTPRPARMEQERVNHIAARLRTERVIAVDGSDAVDIPSDSIATALGTSLTVLDADELGRRGFYGGLVRQGRSVSVQPGAFPMAISEPGLTVVRGRLLPAMIERIRSGYCDIPGTNVATRVHPEALVLVTPG